MCIVDARCPERTQTQAEWTLRNTAQRVMFVCKRRKGSDVGEIRAMWTGRRLYRRSFVVLFIILLVVIVLTLLRVFCVLFRLLRIGRLVALVEFVLCLRDDEKLFKKSISRNTPASASSHPCRTRRQEARRPQQSCRP